MKIDHIFHNFNSFGGAEEHITTLAEIQKSQGEDVSVCLIQSINPENQYAKRLKAARVPVSEWPIWLSRLSGDWDTRERILRRSIKWLTPLVLAVVPLMTLTRRWSRDRARESVEGRLQSIIGRFLNPLWEKRLFLLLLHWRFYRRRPDILHLHSYNSDLDFVLNWARTRNLPVVYQEHSTPDSITVRPGSSNGINLSSVVVAVSEASAQALREHWDVVRPIEVIPPVLALTARKSAKASTAVEESRTITVLTIARLSEEKGLSFLIQAAKRVLAVSPNVRFLIYGEGPLREALEEEIAGALLQEQVYLAGSFSRDDLADVLGKADIFVLPSLTEGFPLSIVEAMAWGLPIVTTKVGGIPEVVQDGVTALMCPPRDAGSLGNAILSLVSNPRQAQTLGVAARESFSSDRFKPSSLAARFSTVYSKAIQMQAKGQKSSQAGSLSPSQP